MHNPIWLRPDKLCKRVEERTTSLARLSAFQVQVQAFLHHAFLEQEAIHRALRDDPLGNLPSSVWGFPPRSGPGCYGVLSIPPQHRSTGSPCTCRQRSGWTIVRDCSSPSSPASGRPGFPVYNRKDLLALPLNSDLVFAGKFSETVKATTGHPGGRFPSPALEPGTAACTGSFYFGIPHPEEAAGTEAFVFGPGQDSHNL